MFRRGNYKHRRALNQALRRELLTNIHLTQTGGGGMFETCLRRPRTIIPGSSSFADVPLDFPSHFEASTSLLLIVCSSGWDQRGRQHTSASCCKSSFCPSHLFEGLGGPPHPPPSLWAIIPVTCRLSGSPCRVIPPDMDPDTDNRHAVKFNGV